jgi:hypothetical protein
LLVHGPDVTGEVEEGKLKGVAGAEQDGVGLNLGTVAQNKRRPGTKTFDSGNLKKMKLLIIIMSKG